MCVCTVVHTCMYCSMCVCAVVFCQLPSTVYTFGLETRRVVHHANSSVRPLMIGNGGINVPRCEKVDSE